MTRTEPTPLAVRSCTAFDRDRRIASGPYVVVALALKAYAHRHPSAPVLIFDDATGKQIDCDLRGSDEEIAARLKTHPSASAPDTHRAPGRPKLGVVAREVTLLPRHWEWLAEQPGGASATLRRLGEEGGRGPTGKARLRSLNERAHRV